MKTMTPWIAVSFVFSLACMKPGQTIQSPAGQACAPWVDRAEQYFKEKKLKVMYGVGAASNIPVVSMRRTAADGDAMAKLARTFKTKVQTLYKSYESVVGTADRSAFEQHKSDVIRNLTDLDLVGVKIIDRCFAPSQNTEYALAAIDAEAFKESLGQMKGLSAQLAQAIRENAKKAFEDMDEMLERQR